MKTKKPFLIIAIIFLFVLCSCNNQERKPIGDIIIRTAQPLDDNTQIKHSEYQLSDKAAFDIPYTILEYYNSRLPENTILDLEYNNYLTGYDYFVTKNASVVIREEPSTSSNVLYTCSKGEKMTTVAAVEGEYVEGLASDVWYRVELIKETDIIVGYIHSKTGYKRHFKFQEMVDRLEYMKYVAENELTTAHISNYKNANGYPPESKYGNNDQYGYRRSTSAAGYYEPSLEADFRYLVDGLTVKIIDEDDTFYKLSVIGFEGEYYVEKKYVSFSNNIEVLTKAVCVDREMQTIVSFEYANGIWMIKSYTFSTTGTSSQYAIPTPLGYFTALEKKSKFVYYRDGTTEISGFAPYAVRFTGGGYLHGVPVGYIVLEDGSLVAPELKEYSQSIGTVPLSHMCVRNYTSHALFLYEFVDIGNSAIVVLE